MPQIIPPPGSTATASTHSALSGRDQPLQHPASAVQVLDIAGNFVGDDAEEVVEELYDRIQALPDLASANPTELTISTVGAVTTLGLSNEICRNNGLAYALSNLPAIYMLRPEFAQKAAGTIRNNTAVFADDPELKVDPGNGYPGLYLLDAMFITTSPTGADMKIQLTLPAGSTGNLVNMAPPTDVGASQAGSLDWTPRTGTATGALIGGTGAPVGSFLRGVLNLTATNPTAVTVQWAQNVATVGNTTMGLGSYLLLTRI